MAKKNSTYDDEPNPFAMSEEEYAIARDEYNKKAEAEIEKDEARRKSQNKNPGAL